MKEHITLPLIRDYQRKIFKPNLNFASQKTYSILDIPSWTPHDNMKDPYQLAQTRRKEKKTGIVDILRDASFVAGLGSMVYFSLVASENGLKEAAYWPNMLQSPVQKADMDRQKKRPSKDIGKGNQRNRDYISIGYHLNQLPQDKPANKNIIPPALDPSVPNKWIRDKPLEKRVDDIIDSYTRDKEKFLDGFIVQMKKKLPGEHDLEGYLGLLCEKEGIPYGLMKAQFDQESGFKHRDKNGHLLRSNANPPAEGIAQLLPGTALYVNRIVLEDLASDRNSPVFREIRKLMGEHATSLSDLYEMQGALKKSISGGESKIAGALSKMKNVPSEQAQSLARSLKQIRADLDSDRKTYHNVVNIIDALESKDLELSRKRGDYNLLKGFAYFRYCLRPEDGKNVSVADHALAMARYHSGPGMIDRNNGIPRGKNVLEYVNVLNTPLQNGNGIYFVLPKDSLPLISDKTGFPQHELESLNPGLKGFLKNNHSFTIKLSDDADLRRPLYALAPTRRHD